MCTYCSINKRCLECVQNWKRLAQWWLINGHNQIGFPIQWQSRKHLSYSKKVGNGFLELSCDIPQGAQWSCPLFKGDNYLLSPNKYMWVIEGWVSFINIFWIIFFSLLEDLGIERVYILFPTLCPGTQWSFYIRQSQTWRWQESEEWRWLFSLGVVRACHSTEGLYSCYYFFYCLQQVI